MGGGNNPKWKDTFTFKRKNENDIIKFVLLNKNIIGYDEIIGEGAISLF